MLIAKGNDCNAKSLAGINMLIKTDEAWNALLDTMSSVTEHASKIVVAYTNLETLQM